MDPGTLIIGSGADYYNYRISSSADNTPTCCEEYDDTAYTCITNLDYAPLKLPDDFDLKLQMQREAVLEKTLDLRDYLRSGDPKRYFLRTCAVSAVANRENLKRLSNQIRAPDYRDSQK